MDSTSPLLELPEPVWSQIIFNSITDVRDRVSACLACCRFWGYWACAVVQELQGRRVVLGAGRFMQHWESADGSAALHFQPDTRGPRLEWLHLLDRFLAQSVPPGFTYSSYLRLPSCGSRESAKAAQQPPQATAKRTQRIPPLATSAASGTASIKQSVAQPGVWVALPPDFQHNQQRPAAESAVGGCVGHLHRSTGLSICLLMSGTADSYFFELPRLQLVLSVDRAARTADAWLQLCQVRPVLRPGLCALRA